MKNIKVLWLVLLALVVNACTESEIEMNYALPGPQNAGVAKFERKAATISWEYDRSDVQYFIIELSEKEDFSNSLVKDTISNDVREYTFTGLGSQVLYYVRVSTRTNDRMTNPQPVVFSFRSAEIENIFKPFGEDDIEIESAKLKWNAPAEGSVTHIVITPIAGGDSRRIDLTATNIANKEVVIDDLVSATSYFVEIFDNDEVRGEITFTTVDRNASITIEGDSKLYRTIHAAIAAASSGAVINVGATTYDFNDLGRVAVENKSLTIRGLDGVPTLRMQGFNLIGNVENFELSGLKIVSTTSTNHAVEVSQVTGSVNVVVEDCDLSGFNSGVFYASSSATAASYGFSVDNCIIHDIGAEGGDVIDFRAGTLTGFLIKNTTFYNLGRDFLRIDGGVTYSGGEAMKFANCTFDDLPSRRFIYVRSGSVNLIFDKCLLTNMKNDTANGFSGGGSITFDNCNVFGSFSSRFAQYCTQNNLTTLDPQYADAGKRDYTVGNADLKTAGIGDPRWL